MKQKVNSKPRAANGIDVEKYRWPLFAILSPLDVQVGHVEVELAVENGTDPIPCYDKHVSPPTDEVDGDGGRDEEEDAEQTDDQDDHDMHVTLLPENADSDTQRSSDSEQHFSPSGWVFASDTL